MRSNHGLNELKFLEDIIDAAKNGKADVIQRLQKSSLYYSMHKEAIWMLAKDGHDDAVELLIGKDVFHYTSVSDKEDCAQAVYGFASGGHEKLLNEFEMRHGYTFVFMRAQGYAFAKNIEKVNEYFQYKIKHEALIMFAIYGYIEGGHLETNVDLQELLIKSSNEAMKKALVEDYEMRQKMHTSIASIRLGK